MAYKVITPVATEPVSLAEANLHLKITASISDVTAQADDPLVSTWITMAREFGEHYTGRAFAAQTLEMALPCFPGYEDDFIDLDLSPVSSITSIKYTDSAGVEQTVSPSAYALSTYGDSRRVAPTYGNYWPTTQAIPDAVRIRYVTGYPILPKAAKSAMLLLIAHMHEHRQSVSALKLEEVPMGAIDMLNTIKIWSR